MSENESPLPPADDPTISATASRASWLGALLRLWSLRAVAAAPRGNPLAAIGLMSLSWLAAWVVIDWWQRQPQPQFSVEGIPVLAWYALGILGLAALLRWRSIPRPAMGATIVLAAGAAPLPLLLVSVMAAYLTLPWFWCTSAAVAVYLLVYLARGLRAVTGRSQRVPAVIGVVFVIAFIWASDRVDAIPDVWNPRDADAAVSEATLADRESALFEQADRIDAALEHVDRDASASPQAFFLGFAGVGDEKVFAHEIELASRVVGERYRTGERQLSLVNDERHLDGAPLASVSGLDYALQGLASRMQLDRDVLFLAISSHGSQDPAIAVANSQFPLIDLTPADLAGALHDAGIKWRVIIISACYAGGFINALRDPQTIILTAAAADRSSFGCSNDRDLTYFGEAFYRDALPGANSLRSAFDAAKQALAERERREHVTPSNPQAYFGAEMEAKLAAMSAAAARPALALDAKSVRDP
jgi:hypothetical protein